MKRLILILTASGFAALATSACSEDGVATETDLNACLSNDDCEEGFFCLPTEEDPSVKACVEGQATPAWLEITLDPERAVAKPKQRTTPTATVFDTAAQPIPDAEIVWSVEPASAAELVTPEDNLWAFVEEGEITFRACSPVPDPESDVTEVCAERTIIVDAGPPELLVTAPLIGESVISVDNTIKVAGYVTDSPGSNLQVFVDGVPAPIDSDGYFTLQRSAPRFGIQHVQVVATDGLNPPTTVELDALVAPAYRPIPDRPTVSYGLTEAVTLDLGQPFFDDGFDLQLGDETTPTYTRDLADVLDLLLRNVDYLGQLPDPVFDSSNFTLRITRFSPGTPNIELDVTDTGIELYLQLPYMEIDTQGALTVENTSLDLTGSISASLAAYATIDIDRDNFSGTFTAEITGLAVAIESATSNFNDSQANAIFELAESALRGNLEGLLTDTIQSAFIDTIPAILVDLFNSIDGALADQAIPLDLGLGNPINLNINGGIKRFDTVYRNHLAAGLELVFTTDQPNIYPLSPGVPVMVETPLTQPPLFNRRYMQIGVRMALINGLLHGLWASGLFQLDLSNILPESVSGLVQNATTDGRLQPVIVPPRKGEPYDLILEIGQLELSATLLAQEDVYAISIRAGMDIDLTNNTLRLVIAEEPQITTWAISTTGPNPFFTKDALAQLVLSEVWPQLRGGLADSLEFVLPIPGLGDLGGIAPAMAEFQLELVPELPVDVRDDWLVFDTYLQGLLTP